MGVSNGGGLAAWVGIAYGVITIVGGWIWRIQATATKDREELTAQIAAIKLDLAKNYHDSDDLKEALALALAPVIQAIARIEKAIDGRL